MSRVLVQWLVLYVLGMLSVGSGAATLPPRGSTDPRIRVVDYQANDVFDLTGFVGYHLDLEFEEDETFVGLSAGDPEGITYSAHENVLTLKPRVAMTQMNLTVSTSKRRYYFDYSVIAHPPNRFRDEVMYAVRFRYPSRDMKNSDAQISEQLTAARVLRPLNRDYWFCGSSAIKPNAAQDDGVQTRFRFAPRRDLPAVFVSNEDGSESLVNFTVEGDELIVHRVAERFVLRRGKLVGCVVNRSFVGGGESLSSGTVAPDVVRQRRSIVEASP
jgi:type IV secretion system protein VirB9